MGWVLHYTAYKGGGCVQKGPQVESFSFDDFHKVLAWKSFLEIRQDLAMGPSISTYARMGEGFSQTHMTV